MYLPFQDTVSNVIANSECTDNISEVKLNESKKISNSYLKVLGDAEVITLNID